VTESTPSQRGLGRGSFRRLLPIGSSLLAALVIVSGPLLIASCPGSHPAGFGTPSRELSNLPATAPTPLLDPLSVRVVASPSDIDVGQSTSLTAFTSGGVAPYNYSWTGLPTGCAEVDHYSIACAPTVPGKFVVGVTVTDSSVRSAVNATNLTVAADPGASPFSNPWLPYALAASIGAAAALLTVAGSFLRRRRRRKLAPILPLVDSQYVPPPPEEHPL
jgi:hypothetical protein